MKRLSIPLLAALLALSPLAAPAQDDAPQGGMGEGLDLLGEGAKTFLRGLMEEFGPSMRELAQQLRDLEWNGVSIGDLSNYEAPEVLENGDILLRRKEPKVTVSPDENPEIDL
ncbi:AAA+ family ATPase [Oceaniglobus roseus]|uniref:AAA+ family ATPase n=1 Tax=Oceaniglobus roseus TaxID=1737570 RepID=UPI000C7EADA1|nr:AAA+ family ATPase [Kandeliimicrobium roseum]